MKLKLFLFFCFYLFFSFLGNNRLFAQFEVRGKVVDEFNEGIPYTKVRLLKQDSTFIKAGISDSTGIFELTIEAAGSYLFKFSYFGQKDSYKLIDLKSDSIKTIDLGLIPFTNELDEIVVKNNKQLIIKKIDRFEFNVGSTNLVNMATDALDLLSRAPLVEVTYNSINILGKQGAKILINDRLFPLSDDELFVFLRSIPAYEVEKIEVITNPPAQYDAQGNAGLINIVTKKAKLLGTNGYIYLASTQAFYHTGEITASLGHRRQKINISGNINYKNGRIRPIENQLISYDNKENNQYSTHIEKYQRIRGNFGLDFIPNQKTSYSASYSGTLNQVRMTDETQNDILTNRIIDSSIISGGTKNTKSLLNSVNFNFQHKFDSLGKKVVFNGDYIGYSNSASREFHASTRTGNNFYETNRLNGTDQLLNIGSASLDFELPFQKTVWKTGLKSTYITSNYDNQAFFLNNGAQIIDTLQSNEFKYVENTNAAYVSAGWSIKKIEFQVGLRGEDTYTTGRSITLNTVTKKHYFRVYPTVYFLYNINDKNSISLTYGRRINRPSYGSLNPFKYYTTPNNYSQGNPLLSPSYANNYELSYVISNAIIFNCFYSTEKNVMTQAPIFDSLHNTVAVLQSNIGKTSSLGANLTIPFDLNKFSGSLNMNYMVNSFKTELAQFQNTSNNHVFYFSLNADYTWGKNSKYLFSFSSDISPFVLKRGIDIISPMYLLNFSFRMKLFHDNAFITAGINDIFLLTQPPIVAISNGTNVKYVNTYDTRNIRIGFAYMFGNKKMKGRLNKDEKNQDEKNRI